MEGGMDVQWRDGASASRFSPYVERLTRALGHADRVAPFRAYCVGLMLPGQRQSVEPMAARIEPARVGAAHQSLHHFVAQAAWDDAAVLAAVRDMVLPAMEAQAPIRAWIIDDTGMPKKGRHSVGVGRQYCGQVGKQDNCQVAVTLSVATHQASLPIAFRLYLPEAWAGDPTRRAKAGVPEEIAFQTVAELVPPVAGETASAIIGSGGERPSGFWWARPRYQAWPTGCCGLESGDAKAIPVRKVILSRSPAPPPWSRGGACHDATEALPPGAGHCPVHPHAARR